MKGGGESASGNRRGQNRKGVPATKKQRDAMANGTKYAAEKRRARKAARAQEKPRWQQLEDGDITLNDLTLEELVKGQVANNDGSWEGKRHQFTPRMQQKMYTAFRRRFRTDFDQLAPLALDAFEELLTDDENPAQRWAATKTMIEYQMGKPIEVVHHGVETEYDRLTQGTAFIIRRGTDLAQELEAHQEPGDGVDGDVVDAELVEEEA
jgi:hypothetical protein